MLGLAHEQYGLTTEACVRDTGLRDADLLDPAREISGRQELGVLRNILRALGPSVPFGLEAGLRYRTTTHGLWGFGMITCKNVREALVFGVRYFDLTASFNRLSYEVTPSHTRVLYDDSANPDDLRAALVERDIGALFRMRSDILGGQPPLRALQLRVRQPPYADRLKEIAGIAPEFEAPVNSVAVDAKWLDMASPLADEFAFRVCEEQCRVLLERQRAKSATVGRVRARILDRHGPPPSMAEVAADLGASIRTLRNQLTREGTSYREIIQHIHQSLAEELLAADDMNVNQIAERLGYADTSSFVAAFKRWKGASPSAYRKRLKTRRPRSAEGSSAG